MVPVISGFAFLSFGQCVCVCVGGADVCQCLASTQPLAQAIVLAAPLNADRISSCLPESNGLDCIGLFVCLPGPGHVMIYVDNDVQVAQVLTWRGRTAERFLIQTLLFVRVNH